MYLDHFRFSREPFSIAPDPGFLYLSTGHNEALSHLQYGLSHGGFVLITGEVGTGKTTLLRNLVRATPDDMDIAFILNPRLTAKELLESICDELAIQYDRTITVSIKHYIDLLTRYLLQAHRSGRSTVLVIDEAQNLAPAVLEQIRLLTNLETDERKLLRIILIGQPELDEMLARTELRQLSQRITARYRLGPLTAAETQAYVAHRLSTAGGRPSLFTDTAVRLLHRQTGGIPRLINIIADRALLGAFARGLRDVDANIVRQAAIEVLPATRSSWSLRNVSGVVLSVVALLLVGLLAARLLSGHFNEGRTAKAEVTFPQGGVSPADEIRPGPTTVAASPSSRTSDSLHLAGGVQRPPLAAEAIQRVSYAALFKIWGVPYDSDEAVAPCEFAQRVKLLCASRSGTWADIALLDLPVILELQDDEETPFHVAVIGGNATRMTLVVGTQTMEASADDLKSLWFGNFSFLWPQPPLYQSILKKGDLQDGVAILRDRLERALGRPISYTISNVFDDELADALTEFQQREALPIEPNAGPMTWVRLTRVNASRPIPSLRIPVESGP
jgi:general secretion pathway protein A